MCLARESLSVHWVICILGVFSFTQHSVSTILLFLILGGGNRAAKQNVQSDRCKVGVGYWGGTWCEITHLRVYAFACTGPVNSACLHCYLEGCIWCVCHIVRLYVCACPHERECVCTSERVTGKQVHT
uniref:Uncharacterized protein n=1 Tax=Eutreptiella gymnastica TaxID=73025 RepID=A0A7S4FZ18_9EUGL